MPKENSRGSKIISARMDLAEVRRLDAYVGRVSREQRIKHKRGTIVAMLIRKGLDAAEKEVPT